MEKFFYRKVIFFWAIFFLTAIFVSGAPIIKVDTTDINLGSIKEGSSNSIKHTFIIKNMGDEPLVIKKVKVSCGCITAGYDSVIFTDKEGKLTLEIKLNGISYGIVKKYITVISNAKNKPQLRLSITFNINTELEITPKAISLKCDKYGFTKDTFTIITTRSDLQVLEVIFMEESDSKNNSNWKKTLPVPFEFSLIKTDSGLNNGYSKFLLEISKKVDYQNPVTGFLLIKTNHPQKKEVSIYGVILEKGSAPKSQ